MNQLHESAANSADSVPGTGYWVLGRVLRLARKELREILRDRRTIVTLIAMPILLYPLMSVLFLQFSLATRPLAKTTPIYHVGVLTTIEADLLKERLEHGKQALRRGKPAPNDKPAATPPQIELLRQTSPAKQPRTAAEHAEALDELKPLLHSGDLDLIVVIPGLDYAADPRQRSSSERALPCRVYSLSSSVRAREAMTYLERLLAAANEDDLKNRLNFPGAMPRITLLSVEEVVLAAPTEDSLLSLSALVPLVLILMTITGAVYPAIDLTAGERERGTLEILVAAPVPRFELLTAKYMSVVTVAVLNAVVNLVCMTITLRLSGVDALLPGIKQLSFVLLLQVFALLLLFAAFFSAVLLCLTSFARSFKEAQAYLIPLMLASLAPGIMAMMPGLKLGGVLTVLPLVNIVLMARDLFEAGVEPVAGTIVVLTTLMYALAALSLAARVFGAESVLYSEQSSWADLLRRPDDPQATASIPAMLWCLALMVPIQFGLVALLRVLGPFPPIAGIVLQVGINVLLFGLFPALFVYLGRVQLHSGLGLAMPRPVALLAGLELGLALWPLELFLLLHLVDLGGLERFGSVVESVKQTRESVGWGVLAIVVVPAVLEEFFFRGLLFNALKARSGAVVTVGVTALLFGATHVILGGAIGLERFLPSTALGLILGAVCWRTGSLWPGMLLHVCHNAMLVAVDPKEVPWPWVAASLAGAAIGALLLWRWGRPDIREA